MSVSHPLLKELKAYIIHFLDAPKPITDGDGKVSAICMCLETIFSGGVLPHKNALGFLKAPDCWHWIEQMANERYGAQYAYTSSVDSSKTNSKLCTNRGRMRIFIRTALVRRCLHAPVQIIVRRNQLLTYYKTQSILGDEILAEMFLSSIKHLAKLEFKLDLNNARFLDETWTLPNFKYLQLVPCPQVGLSIMFVDGKAVIYEIAPYSVAAEMEEIQVGDIIDDLNGCPITENVQGGLASIVKKAHGGPVTANIIKAEWNGHIFPPMVKLLSQAGLDPATIAASFAKDSESTTNSQEVVLTYLGVVSSGEKGDVKEVQRAISQLLRQRSNAKKLGHVTTDKDIPVFFDFHDLELKVINPKTQEVIMRYSYMEISSCGCTTNNPCYFAFIAGNKQYTDCKDFKTHIFYCNVKSEIDILLRNIAQGFKRTHCAV